MVGTVFNDPKNILFIFFANEYPNQTEFYADFKSEEIIGKKCTQKKLFAQNCCKLVVLYRRQTPILHTFFAYNLFVSKVFAFFSTGLKSA